jgi:hypothetical protein
MPGSRDETSAILHANERYAESFSAELAKLPMPPGRKVALVVCMDAVSSPQHCTPLYSQPPLRRC